MTYRSLVFAAMALAASLPSLAQAREFPLAPGQTAVGQIGTYTTKYSDTLLDVARDNDLGYAQIMVVNRGINPWLPGDDKRVVLPSLYLLPDVPHKGIVLNLPEQRVFYFPPGGKTVETYPIGAGVEGRNTPLGITHIVTKQVHPGWAVPPSIRAERPELPAYIPPGPDNPMGDLAMGLTWRGYYLHGTNKPDGVGRNVSHGCIHFYPEDIDRLFHEVSVGTQVRVINQEVVTGWIDNRLYVAVFPNKEQVDEIDIEQPMTPTMPPDLVQRVRTAAGDQADRVDWALVRHLGIARNGIPTAVTPPLVSEQAAPDADDNRPPEDVAPAAMTIAPPEQSEPLDDASPQPDVSEEQTGAVDDGAAVIERVISSFPNPEK
jgi:L,D-transpeptidase ErfK/SrfK